MLPSYIIEELTKRNKRKGCLEEAIIKCPVPAPVDDDRDDDLSNEKTPSDRGVVILDFTI